METKPTDWQVSHTENSGKTHVLFDFNDDHEDPNGTQIIVKGRDGAAIAALLAELLQREQFQSA